MSIVSDVAKFSLSLVDATLLFETDNERLLFKANSGVLGIDLRADEVLSENFDQNEEKRFGDLLGCCFWFP